MEITLSNMNYPDDDLKGDSERKIIHIITGLAYIPVIYFLDDIAFYILMLFEFAVFLIVVSLAILKQMNYKPVYELTNRWARNKEDYLPLKPTLLLNTGVIVAYLLFPVSIVYAAVAITSLGDGIATIAGKKFGKHKFPYSERKSYEGSFAGLLAAFSGAVLFVSPLQALLGSAGSLFLESIIGRPTRSSSSFDSLFNMLKNDNLILPVASGFLMQVIGKVM